MADLWDNPMGTDGFEFIEYTGPDPAQLGALFERMGFVAAARHRSKNVTLYRQGDVNFIVNAEPESFAQAFARLHGPSVCAIALRVKNAAAAYDRAIGLGAKPVHGKLGPMELNIPAIEGIGGSLIYLVDRYGDNTIYDVDFVPIPGAMDREHAGSAGEEADLIHHRGQLLVHGQLERLARVLTLGPDQLLPPSLNGGGDAVEGEAPLRGGAPPPRGERLGRYAKGAIHVGRRAFGDATDGLFGGC